MTQALGAGHCRDINHVIPNNAKPNKMMEYCPNETKAAKIIKQTSRIRGCIIEGKAFESTEIDEL